MAKEILETTEAEKSTPRPGKMKKNLGDRLKRIEGQVRGIEKMIGADSYCDDVLIQISAAQSALNSVSSLLLEHHINHCVFDRMKAGDEEVVEEFLVTLNRALKK